MSDTGVPVCEHMHCRAQSTDPARLAQALGRELASVLNPALSTHCGGNVMAYPRIPQKRLQTQEETSRKQGDAMCMIVVDVYNRPVVLEYLLGFGVYSGEFRDMFLVRDLRRETRARRATVVTLRCQIARLM